MSGHLELRQAIKRTAHRHAVRQQNLKQATVTGVSPLTVEVHGYQHPLTEDNDFDLSQWMKFYQAIVGIRDGDLVLMNHDDGLVVFDIVSDTDVVGILNAWDRLHGPAGGG